jgi:hypothetical protein
VQSLINLAANGGAWNGVRGITSSSAAANAQHNTTLGAMESERLQEHLRRRRDVRGARSITPPCS